MKLITDTMREIRKGALVDQASAKMADLVMAVIDTGKAGSLVIKLDVKPQEGDRGMVTLTSSLKVTRPEPGVPDAIFYVDADGNLLRNDPDQGEMFKASPGGLRNAN